MSDLTWEASPAQLTQQRLRRMDRFKESAMSLGEAAAEAAGRVHEHERKLKAGLSGIISQAIATTFNSVVAAYWAFLKAQWKIITLFFSSLQIPVFLLSSAPQAIISFIIAPFVLASWIPKAIQALTLNQALASIGSSALAGWFFINFITYRTSKVGRVIDAIWNILFWIPIYSTIIIILSNLGPLRELFGTLAEFLYASPWSAAFVFLFVFKFLKVVVHLFSYYCLSAYRVPLLHPSVLPRDVTVIIPSVGDFGDEFVETVQTILGNHPARIIISTVGAEKLILARRVVEGILRKQRLPGRTIEVVAINKPSKRSQCVHASLIVQTDLIAYADDHVRWPPTFLQSVLSEFEDSTVGIVGTCKRVDRDLGDNWSDSLRNFLACVYLERHNYELTATYNIDGGIWVISGRTQLVRTDIVQSLEYRQRYLSETFLGAGPLNCDDDNFTTRYMLNQGWKTVFHNRPEALIYTTLGTTGGWPKFSSQLLRWARTIWRSHPKTMFIDAKCWKTHPWTSYAMFFSGLLNISILYDPLLFITLFKSEFYTEDNHAGAYLFWALFLSRLAKTLPYYMRHKSEMWWAIPAEFAFGYFHGLLRLVALLTCRDISWGGRDLETWDSTL